MERKVPEFQKLDSLELKVENGVATVFKVNGEEKEWITGISIGWSGDKWSLIMTEDQFFSSDAKNCVPVSKEEV